MRWAMKKYNKLHSNAPLPDVTPHMLRHTFCMDLHFKGLDPKSLQYFMGHSECRTTRNIYTHANYEQAWDALTRERYSTFPIGMTAGKAEVKHCKYRYRELQLTTRFTTHFAGKFTKSCLDFCKMVKSAVAGKISKYKDSRTYKWIYKHDSDIVCTIWQDTNICQKSFKIGHFRTSEARFTPDLHLLKLVQKKNT